MVDGLLASLPRRMVVVAPHADDEVLGAGGLMAKAARLGFEVHVLLMTVSGYPSAYRGDHSATDDREAEVRRALSILGAAGHEILHRGEEHHLRLDTRPMIELVGFVERALARIRPSVVVMPCRGHYHQDHRASADACITALRPAPDGRRPLVPVVLAYGHHGAGWGGAGYRFEPSAFVNIDETIELKLQALAAYESQLCDAPHPRSLEGVRIHAAAAGGMAGCRYAEAFEVLRVLL